MRKLSISLTMVLCILGIYCSKDGNTIGPTNISNKKLAAVGDSGHIYTSDDGTNWILQNSGTSKYLAKIIWTDSGLIAVGDGGLILCSKNGKTWQNLVSGLTIPLYSIASNGHQVVVVGYGGTILTSADNRNWTPGFSGTSYDLYDVTWAGSQFVISGDYGIFLTSSDGVIWSKQMLCNGCDAAMLGITWTGNQLVAVGASPSPFNYTVVSTSPDGINWTIQTRIDSVYAVFSGSGTLCYVIWANNMLLASGPKGRLFNSPDGISWHPHSLSSSLHMAGMTWTGNNFIVVGENGTVLSSPNGNDWTVIASSLFGGYLNAVACFSLQ
jgi:photosystem II stability/assembly factor-like uncharacterized protein